MRYVETNNLVMILTYKIVIFQKQLSFRLMFIKAFLLGEVKSSERFPLDVFSEPYLTMYTSHRVIRYGD